MIYRTIRFLVKTWLHIRFRVKVEGVENIPMGPCLLAMNHRSNYDSLLVGTHTPRKMYIMAKEELFENPIAAKVITEMGAYPIKRGKADLRSLKHSLKLLEKGKIVALFIEGGRSKTDEMQDPKKGIGFLVGKSGAPVIPVYVYGVKNRWFGRAGVRFGQPMRFGAESDYEQIAEQLAVEIMKLAKQ